MSQQYEAALKAKREERLHQHISHDKGLLGRKSTGSTDDDPPEAEVEAEREMPNADDVAEGEAEDQGHDVGMKSTVRHDCTNVGVGAASHT